MNTFYQSMLGWWAIDSLISWGYSKLVRRMWGGGEVERGWLRERKREGERRRACQTIVCRQWASAVGVTGLGGIISYWGGEKTEMAVEDKEEQCGRAELLDEKQRNLA